jgi:hypothetical protein
LCGLLLAEPAWGQAVAQPRAATVAVSSPELSLVVSGECPERGALAAELVPLLHRWRLREGASFDAAAVHTTAVVTDDGASLRVEVIDTVRRVDETRRDCSERARIAAVLIAMALEPPLVSAGGGKASSPTDEPATRASSRAVAGPTGTLQEAAKPGMDTRVPQGSEAGTRPPEAVADGDVAVELSAMVSLGLGEDAVGHSVGPLLGLRIRRGTWAVRTGVGLVVAAELELDEGSAHMTRIPTDISVGYVMQRDGWSLEPSLGLALDPFLVEGEALADANRELRLDVGPRATLQASVGSSTVRGLGALRVAWFPRTYELVVNPAGAVGTTPSFWLELSLGARFGID